jgi:hypothetical protein
LLEALAVELGDYIVLFFQALDTTRERDCDFERVIVNWVIIVWFMVFQGHIHLPNGFDDPMRLFGQFILLTARN